MAIIVRAFEVQRTPLRSKKSIIRIDKMKLGGDDSRTLYDFLKFPNDYNEFDIYNPENWRRFLGKLRLPNGNFLPSKTPDGMDICYEVVILGPSRTQQEYSGIKTGPGGDSGILYLFPGYDPKYPKRKEVMEHGWIRDNNPAKIIKKQKENKKFYDLKKGKK